MNPEALARFAVGHIPEAVAKLGGDLFGYLRTNPDHVGNILDSVVKHLEEGVRLPASRLDLISHRRFRETEYWLKRDIMGASDGDLSHVRSSLLKNYTSTDTFPSARGVYRELYPKLLDLVGSVKPEVGNADYISRVRFLTEPRAGLFSPSDQFARLTQSDMAALWQKLKPALKLNINLLKDWMTKRKLSK
jgi:hypothetical protein